MTGPLRLTTVMTKLIVASSLPGFVQENLGMQGRGFHQNCGDRSAVGEDERRMQQRRMSLIPTVCLQVDRHSAGPQNNKLVRVCASISCCRPARRQGR